MGRGREPLVVCDACGRKVPRSKAVEVTKGVSFDLGDQENVVLNLPTKKVYYCISCAKHRKIFEKKKRRLQRKREREDNI